MRFYLGLDLGQLQDPSAAAILEPTDAGVDVRYLHRWPLGTSYPTVVRDVQALLARPPLGHDCQLVVDASGVGLPVTEMLTEAGLTPIKILITGGASWSRVPHVASTYHVSKAVLVSVTQKYLSAGRLRIAASLREGGTLQRELRDFRVKVSKADNELYDAREGAHDDLLLSLACALWVVEQCAPVKAEPPLLMTRRTPPWYGAIAADLYPYPPPDATRGKT